ncbi:MAG: alpha/beta hydrolase [Pseudomonadota bacterium]
MPHDYMITTRRVRRGRFDGEPGPTRYLKVPDGAGVPAPDHELRGRRGVARWISEVRDLADGQPGPASISICGDVLVYVHGYNTGIDDAMARQRTIARNLSDEGWVGVVIGFDWPSEKSVLNYLEDRSDAKATARYLVEGGIRRLSEGQDAGCQTNVHLLGHSTGAYVIREAFRQSVSEGNLFRSHWRVGQVAFVSADLSASSLSRTSRGSRAMFDRLMRLTNYSNPYDAVLGASNAKRLGVSPRAGRSGLPGDPHPKSVNVNCGEVFKQSMTNNAEASARLGHSWYFENEIFMRDFAMTLEGAIDRNAFPTRRREDGELVLQDGDRLGFMGNLRLREDFNLDRA